MIKTEDGLKLVPELYAVTAESVSEEYKNPGSQDRVALGRVPFMWAQSLFIVAQLLKEVSFFLTFNSPIDNCCFLIGFDRSR